MTNLVLAVSLITNSITPVISLTVSNTQPEIVYALQTSSTTNFLSWDNNDLFIGNGGEAFFLKYATNNLEFFRCVELGPWTP